ncbi:N-acetyltransferase [Pseudomonas fluorescens]|nr:GNAT family N-acetyltransferase [Pseudomonas glycinae]AWA42157.1 N-acetyltransferase [Pseudomonas fluorescens]
MRRKGKGTELRNQTLKSEARKLAHRTVSMDPEALAAGVDATSLGIEPITPVAINAYHQWSGPVSYPWDDVLKWKTKDAKGLDLAFWYEGELCGLCYATPRKSTICIKIILLQGRTGRTHTLRGWIAPMALLTTEFYARRLGCTEFEVQEPDSGAIPYYQKLGFHFDTTDRLVFPLDDQ